MLHAHSLLPPMAGPRSNPVLFGIADGLAKLFPVDALDRPHRQGAPRDGAGERADRDAGHSGRVAKGATG
ncbi:hypothetical protein MMB17_13800 [Methylobacterium organophilum]|uniref:hypothetical protein n=1 Tax=Methylobacterium organophilum TaxID=410 RepID=UPI001F13886E|nr:hypothetical protein [Methylobacterium organophilum]UMY15813.1 hypothetical protein MMB17_13800 [Methylobacterium organophilum]